MTRMKTLACSAGLILVGVAPVAADNYAPKSLRMRAAPAPGPQWSPLRWAKRIAQAGQPADPTPAQMALRSRSNWRRSLTWPTPSITWSIAPPW